MSKLYLQEKINGSPGQYVVVGKDGFLTAGRLVTDVSPILIITTPEGYDVEDFSANCNGEDINISFEKLSAITFSCYLSSFGLWQITANNGTLLSDVIDVSEIAVYNMDLSSGTSASDLNNTSWSVIKSIANEGLASSFWSLGERKAVTLNGTAGGVTYSSVTLYAYIIGFDHNAGIESPGITFQLGFENNSASGKNLALIDSYYNNEQTTNNGSFHMNYQTTYPGWKDCVMRSSLLNGGSNSLLLCLPSDLRAVITPKTIYTNNYSGAVSDTAANYPVNITGTKDNLYLLSEYEIFGTSQYSSQYEADLQNQYDYYKSNSNLKYSYYNGTIGSSTCRYWTRSRSPRASTAYGFCCVEPSTGNRNAYNSLYSLGIAPAFHVGSDIPTSTNIYISAAGSTTTTASYISSYITIVNTSGSVSSKYYTNRKILVDKGSVIRVYGKSGSSAGKVGLKINGVASSTTSSSTSSYTLLDSYSVENTGIIDIELVYSNASASSSTVTYVKLTIY